MINPSTYLSHLQDISAIFIIIIIPFYEKTYWERDDFINYVVYFGNNRIHVVVKFTSDVYF